METIRFSGAIFVSFHQRVTFKKNYVCNVTFFFQIRNLVFIYEF